MNQGRSAESDQGVAVGVVDLAQDDHDRLDEGPWAAHDGTNDGDGQDQLDDTHLGLAEVEVVDTKRAKEKGEQERNDLLFRGGGGHGGLHWGCFHVKKIRFADYIPSSEREAIGHAWLKRVDDRRHP